ncbi:MAG: aldo/keto reductase [Acidimicrobiales bacterium]|jgi:aryl-alcohol dehydrogenase-like predicted oxidoreductase
MEKRRLGKTGWNASVIGFGAWAIGADWGEVGDDTSRAALRAAAESGVNFFDTADVYGDGRSERLVAELRKEVSEPIFIATKAGRRAPEQRVKYYSPENLIAWVNRSRENLQMETLDLVQLHCPPTDLFYHPEVFATLDDLVSSGAIAHYGVSVERVEEGLKALDYPGVATVQIIYNIFRQRPAERFLPAAKAADVGVIVRVPLASGLLTGKMTRDTQFPANDHRNFNRHGESFDVGETFAGVNLETGLETIEEVRALVPPGETMASFALRFCMSDPGVSTVIPGAKNPEQARQNAAAGELGPLDGPTLERLRQIYQERVAPEVHYRW